MKRFENQELASGVVFFAACGWLLLDVVRFAPERAPALWPLIPMFLAVVWYCGIEHVRARGQH